MKIETYLVLNRYLLSLFGFSEPRELFNQLKDKNPGYDSDGRSYFVNTLLALDNLKLSRDHLLKYDERIKLLVRRINARREPVTLKYFQYLAVLFTEIVLDNLKNNRAEFLYNLNAFLVRYKAEQDIKIIDDFTETDLKKLAFWMATGSGKTLIMHINYYQFLDYKPFTPDNIILITPNEGLSKQHFDELQKSGIPARRYAGSLDGGLKTGDEVLVIEMTKFVEEKKGGGVTLPVDTFEGRNLVLVDEGHKGRKSEEQKWAQLRDRLAENGFVFEYSATFGQILSEKNRATLEEYAKSIIYDYSYKYFYLDGYGKDFSVVNVTSGSISEARFRQTMFIANLLSFYQQMLIYEENLPLAKEYNLEKPLWIFVGTTVTGEKKKEKEKKKGEGKEASDIVQIVELFQGVIANEDWVSETVDRILNGNTGLKDEDGNDIFAGRFELLRGRGLDFGDIYQRVFGGRGALGVYVLKNAEGEIGLKTGENDYFGVINIGDVTGFRKLLENRGISVSEDVIRSSLFDDIKNERTTLNVLIGAKKFIEGWDTWRVTSMGLLNIGTGQGPQIIQLFGRGVRLKGKGMTLQRSGEVRIKPLETLNIYGIRSDYLNRFLEAIRREEVEFETVEIPVATQHEKRWENLYTLTRDETRRFEEEQVLRFSVDRETFITLDLLPKISAYQAEEQRSRGIRAQQLRPEVRKMRLAEDLLDLLDWNRIWEEISGFRTARGYWNLILNREELKNLLTSQQYEILALPDALDARTPADLAGLQDIALLVIKKYLDQFYRKHAKRYETENLKYSTVGKQLVLFAFEKGGRYTYTLQIDRKKRQLIAEIRQLANNLNELIREDTRTLPRIYFDRHLYIPILLQSSMINRISPAGLVESETRFVRGLRDYLKSNRDRLSGIELFLLRNYPQSGVGFFNLSGFYPDFLMWVRHGNRQVIVFIDPKGLEHAKELDQEKIRLRDDIKQLEKRLGRDNIRLESFIISATPYNKLIEGRTSPPSKEDYINHHVLFLEDEDWAERLLTAVIPAGNRKNQK